MYASKVTFSAQTRDMLNARPMSGVAKGKLRRQRVIEFIRETPNGEARKYELIAAAGFDYKDDKQYARGHGIIGSMIKRGIIIEKPGSDPKNSYVKQWIVAEDVKTKVKNDHGKMTVPPQDGEATVNLDEQPKPVETTAEDIRAKVAEEYREQRPSTVVLEYAQKVSSAAEVLKGYTKTEELNAYRSGILKAVELLQDV